MLSRLSRAGDDGTRGGSAAAEKPSPFIRFGETTAGEGRPWSQITVLASRRKTVSRQGFFFSPLYALNSTERLMNESGI